MFAVSAPQTVTLNIPGEDKPDAIINFKLNGADSSRCVMQIIYPDGEMHELTFNTRGSLVSSTYTVPQDEEMTEEERRAEPNATSHIVDGRDTTAFNPYEYKAPADADTLYRDPNPGFTQPVQTQEQRDEAEAAKQEAADRAKKQLEDLRAKSNETEEERQARKKEEEDRAWEARMKAQDATTADTGVTEGVATAETFPSQKTQDLVEGKKMDGTPISEAAVQSDPSQPDYNPMAPAPSSPQPGSPPPHPVDQPDPGRVTTSSDFSGDDRGTFDEQERIEKQKTDDALAKKREQEEADRVAEQNRLKAEEDARRNGVNQADAPTSG